MGDPDRLRSPSTFNPLLDSRRAAGQKLAAGIPGTIGAQRGAKSTAAAGSGSSRDGAEQWSRVGGRAVSTPYDGVGGRSFAADGVAADGVRGRSYVPEEVRDGVHRRRGRGGAADGGGGMLTPSLSFQSPEGAVFQTREQREAAVALLELFQRPDGDRRPSVNVPVELQAGVADRDRGGGVTGSHRARRSRLSEMGAGGSDRSSTSQVSAAISMSSIHSHLQRELNKIESEIAELTRIKRNEARSYADMQPSTRSAEEQRRSGVLQSGQAVAAAEGHRQRRHEYIPEHTLQQVGAEYVVGVDKHRQQMPDDQQRVISSKPKRYDDVNSDVSFTNPRRRRLLPVVPVVLNDREARTATFVAEARRRM